MNIRLNEEEILDAINKADSKYSALIRDRAEALNNNSELPAFPDFEQLRRIFVAQAQIKKIVDEALNRGIFAVNSLNQIEWVSESYDARSWSWSTLNVWNT